MTVFSVTACTACGEAVFPPRALCPSCGGRDWRSVEAADGTVEQMTERGGVAIASVRTDAGPVVVARAAASCAPGDVVRLEADGGVPVVASDGGG
jgi:uncharacterized OB-fold protein